MNPFTIQRHIDYQPYKGISAWRKIAIGTWKTTIEAQVHGAADFDARGILKTMAKFKEKGIKITPTTIVAKGIADSMAKCPGINGVLRFGRVYRRKDIDLFLSVSGDDMGDDLSGITIRKCNEKSFEVISKEIAHKVEGVRSGKDDGFKKTKNLLNFIPGMLVRYLLNTISFIQYTLNIWNPLLGPKDPMGSVIVTSMGMFGVDTAFAPLIPYCKCPILFAVGKITEKPVVENSQVVIKPFIALNVTFDHRLMDGRAAGKLLKHLNEFFAELGEGG